MTKFNYKLLLGAFCVLNMLSCPQALAQGFSGKSLRTDGYSTSFHVKGNQPCKSASAWFALEGKNVFCNGRKPKCGP